MEDFKELLNIFNEHEVKYLIVGGYAVIKYTEPRFTKDLDVWVEASRTNARKVYDSLISFGAPLEGLTEEHFASEGFYQMGRPPLRIDVLMAIEGVDFDSAWVNRVLGNFDGVPACFIGLTDLIKNKQTAGRTQDLADAEKLSEALNN